YLKEYLFVHFDHPSASFIKEMKRQLLESKHACFEGKDICLSKEYDQIFLFPKPKAFFYSFPNIESMFEESNPYFRFKKEGEKIESIFLQNTDFPIVVRNVQENDAILLRFGTKKLNRFFIDRKIPMALRKAWPVVVNQKGEVIFVPGIGPDVNHYCEIPNVFMVKL
ncbi:MAG: tRNA lysidine(34) synthetase TilS, partial [Erysipelotrichaceae bacterium]|nr:tRNA lysidine(34) synthetase TilS [Erysipelotrichaceae bacterium]